MTDTAVGDGSILRCGLEVTVLVLVRIAGINHGNELMDTADGDGGVSRCSLGVIVLLLVRIAILVLGMDW